MAHISFRQGIVRTHSNAIQFTAGNTALKHDALNDPVSYTFADGPDDDYLYEEATLVDPAWTDIPVAPVNNPYWLYYELDPLTGERKFGFTLYDPIASGRAPALPQIGQHWFDTRSTQQAMKMWDGNKWLRVIRVFAARVQGSVIDLYDVGTQAGLTTGVFAGLLLFDDENKTKPVKRFDRRGRGKFITTETPIFSQFSNLTGFRPEQSIVDGQAIEPIGAYQCVALKGARKLGLAKNTDPQFACIGISLEETATGEVRSFVTSGYLTDDNFNIRAPNVDFSLPPGTLIFVGDDGQLTTDVPQSISIQRVAVIVDQFTLLVAINPLILYDITLL